MRVPPHTVVFAGKTEYLKDLETFRQRIEPLREELEEQMYCDYLARGLEDSERQVEDARRRVQEEGGIGARLALGGARLNNFLQRSFTLSNALVLAFTSVRENPDGQEIQRAEARDPEQAEQLKKEVARKAGMLAKLRDVVEQLRKEPASETEKDEWVREYEGKTRRPLNEVEHYILKEWNG